VRAQNELAAGQGLRTDNKRVNPMRHSTPFSPAEGRFDTSFLPMHADPMTGPEGAFVSDVTEEDDRVVVIYPHGNQPPKITVHNTPHGVHTVLANGVAVAVVARSNGPELDASEVVLVERYMTHA
jgi:hypothetical protein